MLETGGTSPDDDVRKSFHKDEGIQLGKTSESMRQQITDLEEQLVTVNSSLKLVICLVLSYTSDRNFLRSSRFETKMKSLKYKMTQ